MCGDLTPIRRSACRCNAFLRTATQLLVYSSAVDPGAPLQCPLPPTEKGFGADEMRRSGAQFAAKFELVKDGRGASEWACK